jgi:aspartyl aminopeptidase
MEKFTKEFTSFINNSPNAFYAVEEGKKKLELSSYKELKNEEKWELSSGGKYFVKINESALVAFETGRGEVEESGFRIVASHTDSPGIKIKPNPEIVDNNYLKLNVEVYGGPIFNTWLDRPLSLAGRVYIKGKKIFEPELRLVNIKKPMLIIPNLAIHQNREINKGSELNPQIDLLPIISNVKENFEKNNCLIKILSKELQVKEKDILDFELYLYESSEAILIGIENEFISAGRIDNLASFYASIISLVESDNFDGIKISVAFDNEEIGSRTKQGADSAMLKNILERIVYSLGKNKEEFIRALSKSFIVSADGAHGVHPNQSSKTDITNIPKLNKGITIKYNANFSYTTDAFSAGVIKMLAEEKNIPLQNFVNRSDVGGGSTIGPLSAKHLPINSVDLGIPMLAMHSIRELCGVEDLWSLKELLKYFFQEN